MTKRWTDRLSLRSKSTLVVLLVMATGLLTVALVGVGQMRHLVDAEAERTVNAVTQGIGHASELALTVHDEHELSRLANRFMRDDQILLVAIYDNTGKLITKAARNPALWERYLHGRIGGDDILLGEQTVELSASDNEFSADALDDDRLPDQHGGSVQKHGVVGRVVVGLSTASAMLARREQTQFTAISTTAAAALSVVLIYVLVGAWTRRLNTLVLASKRISDGDFDYCVDEGRDDEIGRLSSAYDRMREAVRQRDGELRAFNETLQQQVLDRTRSLEDALHAAQAADKAKSRFLATMSHEIRTPLNGVVGMVDLLRGTQLDETQQRYAQVARTSADALLSVINDILDFSKIEAGRMELESAPFDLCGMIEDLIETASLAAPRKGLELSCCIQPDLPAQVIGDLGRLRQILINLINNAVKFTERGGIVVRAELAQQNAQSVLVRFSVTDTGIGIPADRLGRLFHSFSQVDASTTRKYGGTGLGLAISKRLAELMDGSIGVESEAGKGSTFWFTVRFKTDVVMEPSNVSPQILRGMRDLRVIIVDDNAVNREILQQQLSGWKLQAKTAADGASALQLMQTAALAGEPFNLAIVDWHMPEMDGIELTKEIRNCDALSRTPVIMLTSIEDQSRSNQLQTIGLAGHLVKPVRQSRLFDAIVHAIRGTTVAAAPAGDLSPASNKSINPATPARTLRVLLAEDDEINQMVASEILAKAGFLCSIVDNGRAAFESAKNNLYDVILMDCQMPEMDGFEATAAIRKHETDTAQIFRIPIIALTANAIKGDRETCLAAGMDEYCSKPIDPIQLIKTIHALAAAAPRPAPVPKTQVTAALPASAIMPPSAAVIPPGKLTVIPGASKMLSQFFQGPESTPDVPPVSPSSMDASAPPMDLKELHARCMSNAAFATKILTRFQQRVGGDLEKLVQTVQQRKLEDAAKLAHALKGSAGNLSAAVVRSIAAEIEQLSRAGDAELAEEALKRLNQEVARCLDFIPEAIATLAKDEMKQVPA